MISVVVLTKNSSAYLARCLQALALFTEVVVVDNGSSDDTLAIAANYPNVKIYQREFCGFGPLKNIAAELAANDWVLFIDSDEVLAPQLASELLNLKLEPEHVYQLYRQNYYANLLIDGCSWDNDYVTRLYNRKVTAFNNNQVHESIQSKGLKVIQLKAAKGFIYHFPYRNTSQLMAKLEHYAGLYAENNYAKKKVKAWTIPLRGMLAFFKSYVLKKGFLYGYEGLTISAYNAMGVFVKYLKLYELAQRCNLALAISIEDNLAEFDSLILNLNQQSLLAVQIVFLIDERVLAGNSVSLQTRLQQQLVIPAQIIAYSNQDSELLLQNHLISRPDLDGAVFLYKQELLVNRQATFLIRQDFRNDKAIDYARVFRQK